MVSAQCLGMIHYCTILERVSVKTRKPFLLIPCYTNLYRDKGWFIHALPIFMGAPRVLRCAVLYRHKESNSQLP